MNLSDFNVDTFVWFLVLFPISCFFFSCHSLLFRVSVLSFFKSFVMSWEVFAFVNKCICIACSSLLYTQLQHQPHQQQQKQRYQTPASLKVYKDFLLFLLVLLSFWFYLKCLSACLYSFYYFFACFCAFFVNSSLQVNTHNDGTSSILSLNRNDYNF